eukprot:53165_1
MEVNDESSLKRQLIREVLDRHPFKMLYADEWDVVPGFTQYGRGDLVFKHPDSEVFLVVETKYITMNAGRTSRIRRTRGRRTVVDQALRYGEIFKRQHPRAAVDVATCTNECGLHILGHCTPNSFEFHDGPSFTDLPIIT